MEKSKQSYYVMPFYKKIWYNIKNYVLEKIHNFKFPYATVIFFLLLIGVFGTIVLVIKNNKIEIVPRPEYILDENFYDLAEKVKENEGYEFQTIKLENNNYIFELNEENTHFTLTDKNTENVYESNPINGEEEVFTLYYAANRGQERPFDSYSKCTKGYNVKIKVLDNDDEQSIELIYTVGNTGVVKEDFPAKITESLYKEMETAINEYKNDEMNSTALLKYKLNLKSGLKIYTQDLSEKGEEKVYLRKTDAGNGVAFDYLYVLFYEICGFTRETVDEQNQLFGVTEVREDAVFQVGLKYILHEDRLETKVINDAFVESAKYPIIGIDLLPYFNAGKETEQGYILIPDGSGILIDFNNNKTNAVYEKRIYGSDNGINKYYQTEETENITMPLFGIKNEEKSILSVVKQGAEMTKIVARSSTPSLYPQNTCAYKFYLREGLDYKFDGWNSEQSVTGWTKSYITDDFIVDYYFLEDDANYVKMAEKTKEIFFKDLDDIQNQLKLDLNVLGAYKKQESVLGFPVTKVDTLTNLKQIETILNSLNGIENININFEGMFNDGLTHYSLEKIKLNKAMGTKDELVKVLEKYSSNKQLYVSLNLGSLYTDKNFDEKDYAVRDPFSDIVEHYQFDEPTNVPLQGQDPLYTIKASLITDYNKKAMEQLKALQVNAINVLDLGNTISGSYRNKDTEFRDQALNEYYELLQQYKDNGFKLNAYAPNIYMIKYLSSANGIPSSGTLYNATDRIVPFYQLVLSGKIEYSSRSINLEDQYSLDYHVLKAIETGSNLNFTISHDNTSELMKTYFHKYYNTHYVNQVDKIKEVYNELNSIGYANGYLVNHEVLADDIIKVTYSNGISIILNYSNKVYNEIQPLGYKVV